VLCQDFRHFAASRLGLYYDVADIRRFVAGMGVGRLILLRGMSGTGKTSLAYAAGEFFGNPATVVPIQPMWKERSDIIGYFNEFTKRFNETTLLCKLYEAGGSNQLYMTVLDEVNIARIEYYFAEFLSLLEIPDPQKRLLDVVADSWDTDPKRLADGKLLLRKDRFMFSLRDRKAYHLPSANENVVKIG
jgi:5-methylcytosine-specific restriction endonuclease McrBC GTP-binding regulatory subunit McrB